MLAEGLVEGFVVELEEGRCGLNEVGVGWWVVMYLREA